VNRKHLGSAETIDRGASHNFRHARLVGFLSVFFFDRHNDVEPAYRVPRSPDERIASVPRGRTPLSVDYWTLPVQSLDAEGMRVQRMMWQSDCEETPDG
jgi:hypothetical protein